MISMCVLQDVLAEWMCVHDHGTPYRRLGHQQRFSNGAGGRLCNVGTHINLRKGQSLSPWSYLAVVESHRPAQSEPWMLHNVLRQC